MELKPSRQIPINLKRSCEVSPPPTLNRLKKPLLMGGMDIWEARFLLMVDEWIKQTGNLDVCNLQLELLREWERKQLELEAANDIRRSLGESR